MYLKMRDADCSIQPAVRNDEKDEGNDGLVRSGCQSLHSANSRPAATRGGTRNLTDHVVELTISSDPNRNPNWIEFDPLIVLRVPILTRGTFKSGRKC